MPRLSFRDLQNALGQFSARYDAVEVFADDVEEIGELARGGAPAGVHRTSPDGRTLLVAIDGSHFRATLDIAGGMLRFSREPTPPKVLELGSLGAVAGATLAAATSKKGDAWVAGLIVGLLAGATIAVATTPTPPRRVFTMQFDPDTRQWLAYDGGLVPWLKEAAAG